MSTNKEILDKYMGCEANTNSHRKPNKRGEEYCKICWRKVAENNREEKTKNKENQVSELRIVSY